MFYLASSLSALLLPIAFVHGHGHGAQFSSRLMRKDLHHSEGPASAQLTSKDSEPGQPLPEPKNFVINCPGDVNRLARFRKHMDKAGLTFEVFPCVQLTRETLKMAIHDGFFGPLAERGDLKSSGALGVALAHMKLLKLIISRNIPAANIFEDDEVIYDTYQKDRSRVLASLPAHAEFINLNPRNPRGEPVAGTDGKLLRLKPGIPMEWGQSNIWLSNYLVTAEGAQRLLKIMRRFDLGPSGVEQIDYYVVDVIASGCSICHLNAYAFATNVLSMHCENASMKEKLNKNGMGASLLSGDPIDPVCMEDSPEGLWR